MDSELNTTAPSPPTRPGSNAAADLIRQKIERIHQSEPNEPNAQVEIRDSVAAGPARSKHQQFMYDLSVSGKPLAEIQTAWHTYYEQLSDREKHEVWQEFYDAHAANKANTNSVPTIRHFVPPQPEAVRTSLSFEDLPSASTHHATGIAKHLSRHASTKRADEHTSATRHQAKHRAAKVTYKAKSQLSTAKQHLERLKAPKDERIEQSVAEVHKQIVAKVASRAKLSPKHHLKALGFGIAMGCISIMILLFSFFNERLFAPLITPSRSVSATPIIIDPTKTTTVSKESRVIIPKINVEVPVVYDLGTIEEKSIQNALEDGVVHYDTTSMPGEQGNVIIFGHSSNNILNKGKYKFAFVLLSRLETGDLFMLQKDGKQYVYKVFGKRVVKPEEVNILSESPRPAMATLITCDPPGTSINRLLVEAEQISPDPTSNIASSAKPAPAGEKTTIVPGNAPSLFDRIRDFF